MAGVICLSVALSSEPGTLQERRREQRELEAELRVLGIDLLAAERAASSGDIEKVKETLKKAPKLVYYAYGHHKPSPGWGYTLLHFAVEGGQKGVAALLLESGADVNAQNERAPTPLHVAAKEGRAGMAKFLFRHGADPMARTGDGITPLHTAVLASHRDLAAILIRAGAKTDFFIEAGMGQLKSVRRRVTADPGLVDTTDGARRPALEYAAANGQVAAARFLLDRGAKVGCKSRTWTPLHSAAGHGHAGMVKLLADRGSDVNAQIGWGTPLHLAAANGNTRAIKALLDHGADLRAENEWGDTPLHRAAREGNTKAVRVLLGRGANVNAGSGALNLPNADPIIEGEDEESESLLFTPLHEAAIEGHRDTVRLLLRKGADVRARTQWGSTPLHHAVSRGIAGSNHRSVVKLLVASGAEIGARDRRGLTPLLEALEHQWFDGYHDRKGIVELLLSLGADANTRDKEGERAIDKAAQLEDEALIRLLKRSIAKAHAHSPDPGP